MARIHAGIARRTLDRRPGGLARFFAVGPVADDRAEARIGESLHFSWLSLRGDIKAIREASWLGHA